MLLQECNFLGHHKRETYYQLTIIQKVAFNIIVIFQLL